MLSRDLYARSWRIRSRPSTGYLLVRKLSDLRRAVTTGARHVGHVARARFRKGAGQPPVYVPTYRR